MKDRINYYIFLPLIFAAFFLETSFFAPLLGGLFQPQLVFMFLLAAVFLSASSDFLYLAFLFGFLFDICFGAEFGIYTISLVGVSVLSSLLKDKLIKEESFGKVAKASVIAALSYNLFLFSLFSFLFGAEKIFDPAFLGKKVLFDSVYAAILVYPMMRIISKGKE
jgi:rod shape-determining protein MreD